ncbi:hypothetical protein BRD04_06405 [Halobacteriales archaeon QS_9_67_17]|nr:MAG: hypothetical protein BRD04_06405 [Halobacteriales archaeon QS_9_67_17]
MDPSPSVNDERHTRVRQQEVVADISRQAVETADLDSLLADAVAAVAETLNTDYCGAFELTGGDELRLRSGVGWQDGDDARVPATGDSQPGAALTADRPVVVDDLRTDNRFTGAALLTRHGVTSGVSVPVGPSAEPWGVLGAYTTEKRGFTERDATFLRSVANVLATAIETRQTKAEIEETEQFLRDAKSQLEAATEAGAVGTWEWRLQPDKIVAGPSFAETFDVDPEAARDGVSPDQFIAAIHDDDRERVERAIEEALATCGEYEAEYRVWNADDELRWVVARGRVECDEDGTPVTFPGALTDITERKRAELERRRSKEQLESLFEVLPVGVIVADADGHIVRANEAARQLAGTGLDDADSIAEYHQNQTVCTDAGEPVDSAEWTISRVLDGETVTHPDPDVYEIGSDDGESRIVRVTGKPVRDEHGDVTRGVVTLTDITERRAYERKLEESNEQLDQFAHAVSHDLQEPLRMVSGYLELLEDRYGDDLDGDAKEFMDFAVDGAERMSGMIQGLLEYSRIDTRGAPLEPVELDDVLADVRDTLRMRIEETDAEITADPLPCVEGDAGQLRQLFQNLLDNAIEYSGDDPPRIHVAADRDGAAWTISVSDDGIGVDTDAATDLFGVFERHHGAEEYDGMGIGLALCERIVDRHGGDIWFDSEPDEGATVSFTLPAPDA